MGEHDPVPADFGQERTQLSQVTSQSPGTLPTIHTHIHLKGLLQAAN